MCVEWERGEIMVSMFRGLASVWARRQEQKWANFFGRLTSVYAKIEGEESNVAQVEKCKFIDASVPNPKSLIGLQTSQESPGLQGLVPFSLNSAQQSYNVSLRTVTLGASSDNPGVS